MFNPDGANPLKPSPGMPRGAPDQFPLPYRVMFPIVVELASRRAIQSGSIDA
jgi:hypothetical protein